MCEGGSQQLTYLDVAGEYGLVLAVLVGRREEVMGWEIGCDSHTYCLLAHILVVGLCNQVHGERMGSKVHVLVVDAQHGTLEKLNCLGSSVKEGLAMG